MHLDASDAHLGARGLGAQLVALADRARPEGAGDHGSDAAQGEDPVDVEPGRSEQSRVLTPRRGRRERGTELVEALPGLGADRDDHRTRDELPRLLQHELERVRIGRVRLRHRHDAVLDPEQPEDRQVLVRLRPGALGCVDHEQEEVDARRAGDHVADEALVARDVDHGQTPPVRELERRVAEVDRDPALLLLGQPVGVLSGQRPDEPRLAVVDVTGSADRQRHFRVLIGARSRPLPRPPLPRGRSAFGSRGATGRPG